MPPTSLKRKPVPPVPSFSDDGVSSRPSKRTQVQKKRGGEEEEEERKSSGSDGEGGDDEEEEEGNGEGEEEEEEKRLVVAPSSVVAVTKPTTTVTIEEEEEEDSLTRFMPTTAAAPKPKLRPAKKTIYPEQAWHTWHQHNYTNLHVFDFDPVAAGPEPTLNEEGNDTRVERTLLGNIYIQPTCERTKDRVTQKWIDKPGGEKFVNVKMKKAATQHFPPLGDLTLGLHLVTPFCVAPWLKLGPTVETGVEGTRGKVVDGQVTKDEDSKYEFNVSTRAYSRLVKDSDGKNPWASRYINETRKAINRVLRKKMCEIPELLTKVREERIKREAEKKKKGKLLSQSDKEALGRPLDQWIEEEGLWKTRELTNTFNEETNEETGFNVSVFRTLRTDYVTKEPLETPEEPVSDLFKVVTVNNKGKPLVRNNLPVYRLRRHDEVIPGVKQSLLIQVPFGEYILTRNSVISVLYKVGVYEWKRDKAGTTQKPVALIYLNELEELAKFTEENPPVECNPLEAMPMAGVPITPAQWEERIAAEAARIAQAMEEEAMIKATEAAEAAVSK